MAVPKPPLPVVLAGACRVDSVSTSRASASIERPWRAARTWSLCLTASSRLRMVSTAMQSMIASSASNDCNAFEGLPIQPGRQQLRKQVVVIGFELRDIRLGVPLRIQIVLVELEHPLKHGPILVVAEVVVSAMPMPGVDRVEAQHVQRLARQVRLPPPRHGKEL